MPSYNRVIIMGNLTRNPEVRYTPAGTAVADIGVAMNEKFKDKEGNERENVVFVDVVAWGRKAEVIAEYCHKGSALHIEGRLQLDQWENQQGEKRSKLRVRLDSFEFLNGSDKKETASPQSPPAGGSSDVPADFDEYEDDIPF